MTLIENVLNRFGFISEKQFTDKITEALKREIGNIPDWLGETAESNKWNQPNPAIFAYQADMYRLSPILGTALDILGGDVGTSKFNVKRMVGEETRDIPNHEFEILLRNPNPVDTGMEFLADTVTNRKLNGNAIWWLNRPDPYSPPDEIWTIPYNMVEPVPDKRLYLSHYLYIVDGKELRLETWEVVHFKGRKSPYNPFVGISPLESLAVTLEGDLAMRRTNTINYAEYGGAPQSILAFKDFVGNEAWNKIKEEKREAAKKNAMMMLRGVGEGVSWLQRAMSNKDADYINGLRQNMTDIFNRMCPGLLGMLSDSATEANALAARATYAEKTLWVAEEEIAQKITADILPAYGRKLIGQFDDPRVVDRKLKLEEQTAYERSHTYEEVRKEYYQDEPFGDERDKLLVGEAKSQPVNVQPPQNKVEENNAPVEEVQDEDDSLSVKAREDILKWRKMALRGKSKALKFVSDYIPVAMMQDIKNKLMILEGDAVKAMFDSKLSELENMNKRPSEILEAIRLGVIALEKQ